jgi:ketosteroid isomerase-like protein
VTPSNLEMLAAGFARFDEGDLEGVVALAAPDIHAHIPATMANSGDYYGPDEFRLMLERWTSAWGDYRNEIENVVEYGPDRIVVSTRFIARGAGSGAPVDQLQAHFIEVRDGRMTQWRLFHTQETAMQHAATL